MRKKVLGFTLIELMIVVAIIAIIAAIAIPGLLRARISANEGSASAGMRSLAAAQTNFAKSNSVDQDKDGCGEYGVFNELCGATNRRGSYIGATPLNQLPALEVTDMSQSFKVGSSNAQKSGYFFKMYLPGPSSTFPIEDSNADNSAMSLNPLNSSNTGQDQAIQTQENRWICYAWPATFQSSGVRCFVVDQGAEVYASANVSPGTNTPIYENLTFPTYSAAMRATSTSGSTVSISAAQWSNVCVRDNGNAVDVNHFWLPTGS